MLAGVNIGLMEISAAEKRAYHHGDLRNALITAAAELAQKGGPTSVTIRAAAREVGVTPTAAYRHFANHDELLTATKDRATEELGAHMAAELAKRSPVDDDPVRAALGRMGAVGRGYLSFAQAQPGLFHTVFSPGGTVLDEAVQRDDDNPFQLLLSCLDELVEVGYLAPANRDLAEVATWAMVHGLATLLDGPLRAVPEEVREAAIVRGMLTLGHGLAANGLTSDQEKLLAAEMRA